VVIPQVGAGKSFARHPVPATSHRNRLPPVYHLAEGNRPVMAAKAQQRRSRRLPRLGDGRRARVRYVGCRGIRPIPQWSFRTRRVRDVAELAESALARCLRLAWTTRRQVVQAIANTRLGHTRRP
jgi:hypothetical protein